MTITKTLKFLFLLIVFLGSHAHAKWTYEEKDSGGTVVVSAVSEWVSPEKSLDHPYNKLRASINYSCSKQNESLSIMFSDKLPLAHDDLPFVDMRIRFDDDPHTIQMKIISQSKGVSFPNRRTQWYIRKVIQYSSASVEVVIKDTSPARFTFDLTEAYHVINKAQKTCSEPQEIIYGSVLYPRSAASVISTHLYPLSFVNPKETKE